MSDQHIREYSRPVSVWYLITIVLMVVTSITGIVIYSFMTPNASHGAFIGFVSALVGPLMVGLLALLRSEQNTRMTLALAHESREARVEAKEAREEARRDAMEAKEEASKTRELTQETHSLVNSRLEEFKALIAEIERAKGHREGMQQGRRESEARTDALYEGHDNIVHHEGVIHHEGAMPEVPPPQEEPEPQGPEPRPPYEV